MASRGYGENGLTWGFEKGPGLKLKETKERAREKAKESEKEKEKEVEVKMEEVGDGLDKYWADAKAAGGFGGASANGRSASSGTAEDA